MPGLSWVSDGDEEEISTKIANEVEGKCWYALVVTKKWDEALLSQIRNFDFRYIRTDNLALSWRDFLNKLWRIVR